MNGGSERAGDRVYRALLRAYPASFRASYGREMMLAFRDAHRRAHGARLRFWTDIALDLLRSAPVLHLEALRARPRATSTPSPRQAPMKTMGILAVLIGVLQAVNAMVELSAGGAPGNALPFAAVVLAIVLGLLLIAAGVAMLGRARSAPLLARLSAVAWLALVFVVRAVHPWMSNASMLLAVVFPVALLVLFQRGRGRATPV